MSGQRAAYLRRQTVFRWGSITLAVTFFLLPLLGALEFTTQGPGGTGHTADTWTTLVDVGKITTDYPACARGSWPRWAWRSSPRWSCSSSSCRR